MPEDPIEDKSLEASPPEIPGMERLDRRKTPVGEVDQEEQKRFREVATRWMVDQMRSGEISNYRLVPEKLLVIDSKNFYDKGYTGSTGGQRVRRDYYPKGALYRYDGIAAVHLYREDGNRYYIETIKKDIESRQDSRFLDFGSLEEGLELIVHSPNFYASICYDKDDTLVSLAFERPAFLGDYINVPFTSIKRYGNKSYAIKGGLKVDLKVDEGDPNYVLVTSTKGETGPVLRILKVPVKVDTPKIREELEVGLNLEDPYNDPPSADRWKEKNLEKVVGIVEVPKETKAPK